MFLVVGVVALVAALLAVLLRYVGRKGAPFPGLEGPTQN
jgi:hypothetical protein